jgi:hypothetical protein
MQNKEFCLQICIENVCTLSCLDENTDQKLKAVGLQMNAYFHEKFKNVFKSKIL